VPIPGTTKLERLKENNRGASLELSPADVRDIAAAVAAIPLQGARYPANLQKLIGR
jgi:aryl-alcohol dehydrogenase-like predicted oxidoreductase